MKNKTVKSRVENSEKMRLKTIILILMFISIGYLMLSSFLYAAVPQRINYQGKLLDSAGDPVSDGNRNITFRIFNVSSGGGALWSEIQSVNTEDGLFNVILGSVSSINLDFNQDYWLEVQVSGDGAMTPRHRLVSVPYSFRTEDANNSEQLNSQSAGYYLNASNINAGTLSDARLSANVTRLGSNIDASEITTNIVSSIDGVSNDGGNVDLVAGTNITITPNDIANNITISASISGDNLGNHIATQNLRLNGHFLSGDGGSEGIWVNNDGNVGVNLSNVRSLLHIGGTSSNRIIFGGRDDIAANVNSPKVSFFGGLSSGRNVAGPSIQKINTGIYGRGALVFLQHDADDYDTELEVMRVMPNGNLGVGTTNPDKKLVVEEFCTDLNPVTSKCVIKIRNTGETGGNDTLTGIIFSNPYQDRSAGIFTKFGGDDYRDGNILFFTGEDTGVGQDFNEKVRISANGNVGIGRTNPLYPLHMGSGAYCSVAGVWTNASSRKYKENIEELTKEEAMSVLKHLNPVKFNYKVDKEDKYVGFISEDVPELVATKDRKGLCSMDIVGVLTKAVQEQQIIIEKLNCRISELENKIK